MNEYKMIGELLCKAKSIGRDQLIKALATQQTEGGLLGQILVAQKACSRANIRDVLEEQRNITTVDLKKINVDPKVIKLLPLSFCEEHRLVPFERIDNDLYIAMSNVLDGWTKTNIRQATLLRVKIFNADWEDIKNTIEKHQPVKCV